jgi:hypothetical protein
MGSPKAEACWATRQALRRSGAASPCHSQAEHQTARMAHNLHSLPTACSSSATRPENYMTAKALAAPLVARWGSTNASRLSRMSVLFAATSEWTRFAA